MQFQKKGLKNERKRAPVNQDMSSSFMPVGGLLWLSLAAVGLVSCSGWSLGQHFPQQPHVVCKASSNAWQPCVGGRHAVAAPLMLAKKKKKVVGKVGKAADRALAALDQFEAAAGIAPGAPESAKEKRNKKKEHEKAAAAAMAAADGEGAADPFAIAIPEGMAPAEPEPLRNQKQATEAADEPVASAAVPSAPKADAGVGEGGGTGQTMAKKVALICAELGVDSGLPVAKAVAAANEAMGLEVEGALAQQVQTLMEQLGIETMAAAPPA